MIQDNEISHTQHNKVDADTHSTYVALYKKLASNHIQHYALLQQYQLKHLFVLWLSIIYTNYCN